MKPIRTEERIGFNLELDVKLKENKDEIPFTYIFILSNISLILSRFKIFSQLFKLFVQRRWKCHDKSVTIFLGIIDFYFWKTSDKVFAKVLRSSSSLLTSVASKMGLVSLFRRVTSLGCFIRWSLPTFDLHMIMKTWRHPFAPKQRLCPEKIKEGEKQINIRWSRSGRWIFYFET